MLAEKSNGTFDVEGFRQRAAILLFRDPSQSEVLLVSCLGSPNCWSVPGGGIELHETPMEAAHRELCEETGARGMITGYLGVHERCTGRPHRTHVFSMIMQGADEHFPEKHLGRRWRWFSVEEALQQLQQSKPFQCNYFGSAFLNAVPSPDGHAPRAQASSPSLS